MATDPAAFFFFNVKLNSTTACKPLSPREEYLIVDSCLHETLFKIPLLTVASQR